MVAVLRGGAGGVALVLCLSGLANLPDYNAEVAEDERRLASAHLGTRPADLLAFLRKQIPDPERLIQAKVLIAQLSHDNFRVRESAAAQLMQMGTPILPLLKEAKSRGDLETQRRADRCYQGITQANSPPLLSAACRLLTFHRPTGATKALLDYLPFAADEETAAEARDALAELGLYDSAAEQSLEAAIQSEYFVQRAVAGLVLGRRGSPRQYQMAKGLLDDPEATVRLLAAQGLLARGDQSAVSALISLLAEPAPTGPEAEDVLAGLAGESAPGVVWTDNAEARKSCQSAWQGWWLRNRTKVNLAKSMATRPQGPVARSRAAAQQFLGALSRGDFAAFKRTVDIPFYLGGLVTFTAPEEFDQLFRQVVNEQKNEKKNLSFSVLGVGSFSDFQKNLGEVDLQSLKALDASKVQVVYVQGRVAGEHIEKGAVLVKLTQGRALVIGIYESEVKDQKSEVRSQITNADF